MQRLQAWRFGAWLERSPLTPDALAQRSPKLYLVLAALFAVVGHVLSLGFPLAALALLAGVPGAVGATHTAMDWSGLLLQSGIMVGAGAMTAFLWGQKMPLPSGRPLDAAERAPFDDLIASARGDAGLSRPDEVRITDGHQVASMCVPRHGFALFNRRLLLLGLPTLQAMTTAQLQAAVRRVLCWPNTLKGWVLHAIASQHQCSRQYHTAYRSQRTIAARIMAALFSVYWPAYQRWSAPALRWYELERDTLLNQQICVDDVLELLAVDTLLRRYLEETFWPAIRDTAKRDAKPPHPHALFASMLREQLPQDLVNQWLADAAQQSPPELAAAPTVRARLANLGSKCLQSVSLDGDKAAGMLLGASLDSVINQIDGIWRQRVRERWRREHARHAKDRARLAALRDRARSHGIQGREAMNFAKLAKHYLTGDDAVAVYRQIAAMNPDDAKILLGVGRLLLSNGIADGATHVQHAARLEPRMAAKTRKITAQYPVTTRDGSGIASASNHVA